MCGENCHGCQICFEDRLEEKYGEEWWNHPDIEAAFKYIPEPEQTAPEAEDLPF